MNVHIIHLLFLSFDYAIIVLLLLYLRSILKEISDQVLSANVSANLEESSEFTMDDARYSTCFLNTIVILRIIVSA